MVEKTKATLKILQRIEQIMTPYSKWIGRTSSERELVVVLKLCLEHLEKAKESLQS